MKTIQTIWISIFLSVSLFGQIDTVLIHDIELDSSIHVRDSLKLIKDDLNRRVSDLDIKLNAVNLKIKELESEKFILELEANGNVVVGSINSYATGKLKTEPSLNGKTILNIPGGKEVKILDYKNSYFHISYDNQQGWINEVFIITSEDITKFKSQLSHTRSTSSHSISSSFRTTNESKSKKNI